MKRTLKLISLVLAVAMMVVCFASCGEQNAVENFAKENTEYFIGSTGPLTGDASSYGISVNNGATLAVDKINAAGGLNGKNFKFEMKDDKATAADAGTGYDSLYEEACRFQSAALHRALARPSLQNRLKTMYSSSLRPLQMLTLLLRTTLSAYASATLTRVSFRQKS